MEETELVFLLPSYTLEISEKTQNRDWLVHNFNLNKDDDLYDSTNYLYNKHIERISYKLVLDLNIYQFIINSSKKLIAKDEFRDAIALVAFCQIANIEIDPTFALYEKVNYKNHKASEVAKDLLIFHEINNTHTDTLAKYALGFSEHIPTNKKYELDQLDTKEKLTKYSKLKDWDSFYLMILCIINIQLTNNEPREEKLIKYIQWLVEKFRLSLITICYAAIIFSKSPLKGMMKYKSKDSEQSKRKALENMTWDIYLMSRFFEKWTDKADGNEFIFASNDKAFCQILRLAIEVQKNNSFDTFRNFLSNSTVDFLNNLETYKQSEKNRMYKSDQWSPEYREKLILSFEKELLQPT